MSDEKLNWNDLASTKLDDVERPPLRPQGHYIGVFSGKAETGESSKKGTLFATFPVQVNEAMDDVDAEALAAAGGANFKGECTFWLSPKALWMFTEFAEGMGASNELNVLEAAEWLADCGEPIVFQGNHEPNEKNPDRPFFKLQNPVPLSKFQGVSAS
jgi:hypothetical protein